MKTLSEIQQDIRSLEDEMEKLQTSVRRIQSDLELLGNESKTAEFDFDKIRKMAEQIPLKTHPISKIKDLDLCELYVKMLLNLVYLDMDENLLTDRLVLIQWILGHSKSEITLERIYMKGHQSESDYEDFVKKLSGSYREIFMVDALVIANIGGNAGRELFEYIADVGVAFGFDQEKICALAITSKAILCQDWSIAESKIDDANIVKWRYWYAFAQQASKNDKTNLSSTGLRPARDFGLSQTEEPLLRIRSIVVRLAGAYVSNFQWCVEQGAKVKQGDLIATYFNLFGRKEFIKVGKTGNLFYFVYDRVYYGIVTTHEEDDLDLVKEWVQNSEIHVRLG